MIKRIYRRKIYLMVFLLLLMFSMSVTRYDAQGEDERQVVEEPVQSEQSIYLPLVMHGLPMQTVFGANMSLIRDSNGLQEMVDAGMTWTRRSNGVRWSKVEVNEGVYDWNALSYLEEDLINASKEGIRVILIVRSTPEWARKIPGTGPYCGPIREDKLAAFGSFMRELVKRYSKSPYNVKYWELWNEPDVDPAFYDYGDSVFGCWGDKSDHDYYGGDYYAEMLEVAYPQIKAADPEAKVLIGGLLLDCDPINPPADKNCDSSKFLEGILHNNGGPYFDGVSFHAYDYYYGKLGRSGNANWNSAWNTTGPVLDAKLRFIQSVLDQYAVTSKFFMNTEAAIICDGCDSDPTFETTKAYYLAQLNAMAIAKDLRANVWYSVLGWRNSGLLYPDLSPRPAYNAFKFARNELRNAAFIKEITPADIGGVVNVKGYKFNRGDRHVWILWSLDGNAHEITLPSTPLAAWDVFGTPVSLNVSMTIDLKPVYLEWNP